MLPMNHYIIFYKVVGVTNILNLKVIDLCFPTIDSASDQNPYLIDK